MKTMYILYDADKKPLGIFSDKKTRDRQLERCGGSYEEINVRSIKQAYKNVKGYDILMTARELGKLMDYIGGGGSMFPDEELEKTVITFLDKYGNDNDVSTYNSMMSDIFKIAELERHNAFTLGFETAVSLILSRELT